MVNGGIYLDGRYQVISKIGAGGMADVYKGKDCMLNRMVAIKILKKEYREDENFVKKFRSEAQAAAGLLNPNIVNVYDVGEDRGLYYMVMELVEGITLKDYIHKKGRLSTREAISISIQMCTGIAAAHSHEIIHRDIKPQNIIISKDGKVKVTDFGIARAASSNTMTSNAMGSVHYVSPEQARGGYCDERSDIYSVGITMYEMITGEVPFDGESTVTVAMKHLQENIIPPSDVVAGIAPALEDIVLKCTQKSSERRYANIPQLMQDLKRALVEPNGDFVDLSSPRMGDETVMMSPSELERIKNYRRNAGNYDDPYNDYSDGYDRGYDDDGYDDEYDDEYTGKYKVTPRKKNGGDEVDPRMNKMMKILTISAAVIIAFILILVVGKAVGILKIGPGSDKDTEITIEADIEVPSLIGEKKVVAEQICDKKGLELKVVDEKPSDTVKAGCVMEQKTAAGEMVEKNTVIEVVISTGAETKTMIGVAGMDEDSAARALKDAGIENEVSTTYEYSTSVSGGTVIRTNPSEGTELSEDTVIEFVVSKGAEKSEVPKLKGESRSRAETLLANNGLELGDVSEEYSSSYKKGTVISQSISAGQRVDAGTEVDIVISLGEEPAEEVNVPSVVGDSLANAKRILANVGLKYKVVYVDSYSDEGIVIEVDPAEGTSVEVGTTITLQVSNGSLADDVEEEPVEEETESTDTAEDTEE